jgi:heme A synthase
MRRAFGVLAALSLLGALVLAGCGEDQQPGEADKAPPRGPIAFELVEMVTETAAGGMVSPGAVPLADENAVREFSSQFENDRMETRLVQLIDGLEVPEDKAAYAAVVAIGCEVPPDVTVTSTDTGILIEGTKPTTKPVECLAPMTSVAVVLVDESAVGER